MDKRCIVCSRDSSKVLFGIDSRCRSGFKSRCKTCEAEYHKKRRQDNLSSYKDRGSAWRESHRSEIQEKSLAYRRGLRHAAIVHYGGNTPACACCGESEYQFLTIDHIHGGGRKHRRELKNTDFYRWLKKEGYPAGYRVLCYNCNVSRGLYGKCPHEK